MAKLGETLTILWICHISMEFASSMDGGATTLIQEQYKIQTVTKCYGQLMSLSCSAEFTVRVITAKYTQSDRCTEGRHDDACTRDEPEGLQWDICQVDSLTGLHGFIISPNYPQIYQSSLLCSVKVIAPQGHKLNIYVLDLYLAYYKAKDTKRCIDKLWISDSTQRSIDLCTGHQRELVFTTVGGEAVIHFTSDPHSERNAKGFWIYYEAYKIQPEAIINKVTTALTATTRTTTVKPTNYIFQDDTNQSTTASVGRRTASSSENVTKRTWNRLPTLLPPTTTRHRAMASQTQGYIQSTPSVRNVTSLFLHKNSGSIFGRTPHNMVHKSRYNTSHTAPQKDHKRPQNMYMPHKGINENRANIGQDGHWSVFSKNWKYVRQSPDPWDAVMRTLPTPRIFGKEYSGVDREYPETKLVTDLTRRTPWYLRYSHYTTPSPAVRSIPRSPTPLTSSKAPFRIGHVRDENRRMSQTLHRSPVKFRRASSEQNDSFVIEVIPTRDATMDIDELLEKFHFVTEESKKRPTTPRSRQLKHIAHNDQIEPGYTVTYIQKIPVYTTSNAKRGSAVNEVGGSEPFNSADRRPITGNYDLRVNGNGTNLPEEAYLHDKKRIRHLYKKDEEMIREPYKEVILAYGASPPSTPGLPNLAFDSPTTSVEDLSISTTNSLRPYKDTATSVQSWMALRPIDEAIEDLYTEVKQCGSRIPAISHARIQWNRGKSKSADDLLIRRNLDRPKDESASMMMSLNLESFTGYGSARMDTSNDLYCYSSGSLYSDVDTSEGRDMYTVTESNSQRSLPIIPPPTRGSLPTSGYQPRSPLGSLSYEATLLDRDEEIAL
ncbi:hypothetical protein LSH36_92g06036 [Paralvinella palmiformis]|uniref:CUB domain-containing protein n=1 Tax=Paralvinella palmiformis TaxID=53620 RepID=A0AAD9K0M9_9ANNE|nr:hypothetical protein LSH36_92g06036 [Paralvinella palmiformis]